MNTILPARHEAAWQDLRRHIEWAEGFVLVFLFGSPAEVSLLQALLRRTLKARTTTLQEIGGDPEKLPEAALTAVRATTATQREMRSPLWLDANGPPTPTWEGARRGLLARLNEHRELVRGTLARPLVIALPRDWLRPAAEIAPDLWSIRSQSIILEAGPTPVAPADREASSATVRPVDVAFAERLEAEWERLGGKRAADRASLVAAWRATDALLKARRPARAALIAEHALKLTRQACTESGETPEVLRDLSISLNRVGDAARALGRVDEAEGHYAESLQIGRRLREVVGETPEVLRDLSISLNNVGDAARALGRVDEAEGHYAESLQIGRRLREVVGETPEVLRDLSVSLLNCGDLAAARGHRKAARDAFEEGRRIGERLSAMMPAASDSVGLEKIFGERLEKLKD